MLNVIQMPFRFKRKVDVLEQQQTAIWKLGELALTSANLQDVIAEAVVAMTSTLEVELCGVFELLPDRASIELSDGFGWNTDSVGRTVMLVDKASQEGYTLL